MKKTTHTIGVLLFLSVILSGCHINDKPQYSDFYPTGEPYVPKIVTTTYSLYDMVKQLTKGCELDVILLPDPETNPHSYKPSKDDYNFVKECDVLVCIGGDMEGWINDLVVTELDSEVIVRVVPFEDEEYSVDGEIIDNELRDNHYWLSVKQNLEFLNRVEAVLKFEFWEFESIIDDNLQKYREELETIDARMTSIINRATTKHLVFADQFAFKYLAEDYGLTYSALSENCNTDTTITQESIDLVIDEINQNDIPGIFYTDIGDPKIVEEVVNRTGCEAYMLKTCHGVTQEEFDCEMPLTEILNYNIDVFEKVLFGKSE